MGEAGKGQNDLGLGMFLFIPYFLKSCLDSIESV